MTTNVSSPPSTPRPAISTIAEASPRGNRTATSFATAGASSAASSSAIDSGITTTDR